MDIDRRKLFKFVGLGALVACVPGNLTNAEIMGEGKTTYASSVFAYYLVKEGDNLRKISKKLYGNEKDWERIYSDNKKIIGDNPDYIRPGIELRVDYDHALVKFNSQFTNIPEKRGDMV